MSESNGTTRLSKGDLARRIMREIGEAVTYAELNTRLKDESNTGDGCAEPTFYKYRRELWPHLGYGARQSPAAIPDRPEPKAEPSTDWLSQLVRFGVAVETVGGVARARRMLDALEQIERNLSGG